ncbi:MAG: DNA-3-methyladenine glycosylase 2 family protein [bacterium]|nr:DNA-3-methyladenine glycosylase 2 family protein [bacterium]MDE0419207.1 DNA-3-methyladenine glycosylase 2 family protein [bacterium]
MLIEPGTFARTWWQATETLCRRDPRLGAVIERYPGERLEPHGDLFRSLMRAIVGQQISVIASERIWDRLTRHLAAITPRQVARVDADTMRGCGLTNNKARSIAAAAGAMAAWQDTPSGSGEIRQRLLALKGVGPWTVDMVLIFAAGELDVLPVADIGLQRAVAAVYGCERSPDAVRSRATAWRPWRTVATWYLWRDLDPLPVAY